MLGLKARVPVKDLIDALIGQKLLAIGAGDNVARIMPPLIVTDSEIDEGIGRIEAACRVLEAAGGAS
jgi:acetylornithine/N-succinyldiaminopimelate aminotransferase